MKQLTIKENKSTGLIVITVGEYDIVYKGTDRDDAIESLYKYRSERFGELDREKKFVSEDVDSAIESLMREVLFGG